MPQSSEALRLVQGTIPTSPTAVYTVGDGVKLILSAMRFHNSSGASRAVTMWIVPSGSSRDSSTQVLDITLDGSRKTYHEGQLGIVLEPGDVVYLDTDGASISYYLSGATLTTL